MLMEKDNLNFSKAVIQCLRKDQISGNISKPFA